jgi:biotin carboxyl carrier protein
MKYYVKLEDQRYEVEIDDVKSRPIVATIDDERFEVWPEENPQKTTAEPPPAAKPQPLKASPAISSAPVGTDSSKCVLAPLPGVVQVVHVRAGTSVQCAQELFVLEAMKMKNTIRASRDGIIQTIHVTVGDDVQHGQVMMEYKD